VVARAFELQAMAELGYEAQLRRCAGDGAPAEGSGAGFHPARGGMLCAACARTAPGTIPLSAASRRALVELAEADLARCADLALPAEVRSELARALVAYVRHHLESPLRSLAFLNDLHAVRTRPPGAPA